MHLFREKYPIVLNFFFLTLLCLMVFICQKLSLALSSTLVQTSSVFQTFKALLFGFKFDFGFLGAFIFIISLVQFLGLTLGLFFNSGQGLKIGLKPAVWMAYLISSLLLAFISIYGMGDVIYFLDSGRHVTYELRSVVDDPIPILFTAIKSYTSLFIFGLILIASTQFALLRFYQIQFFHNSNYKINSIDSKNSFAKTSKTKTAILYFVELILCLVLGIIMERGGFQGYVIEPSHVYEIANDKLALLITNPSYVLLYELANKTQGENAIPIAITPPTNNLSEILSTFYHGASGPSSTKQGPLFKRLENTQPNIILILLESWSEAETRKPGVSPFFNSLRKQSLTASLMMTSAKRTTEGIFNTFCSYPNPLGGSIARNQLMNFEYQCLPKILSQLGWSTAMYQGTSKETAGTGALAQLLGVQKSSGVDEIHKITLGQHTWGAYDQDIYNTVLDDIPQMSEPYFITINTNTTHDFLLPKNIPFHFGDGDNSAKFTSVLNFADQALEEYFPKLKNASKRPTLFIFVGDHTKGLYNNSMDQFSVPFALYFENYIAPHHVDAVVHQRDIAPTLLDFLNIPIPQNFTGTSLFASDPKFYGDYFTGQNLGWLEFPNWIEIDIFDHNKITCLDIENRQASECTPKHLEMQNRALSYTWLSQKLLFSGQTLKFGDSIRPNSEPKPIIKAN